jgi:hypothetical protein
MDLKYHKFEKKLHKMAYIILTCMDFNASARGHGHIHSIIHNNMSKFGTTMGVTIVDNVCIAITIFSGIKCYFSIFQVAEMTFFCEVSA